MKQVTCLFRTVGCSLSLPCTKCRSATSQTANRLTRPSFHRGYRRVGR